RVLWGISFETAVGDDDELLVIALNIERLPLAVPAGHAESHALNFHAIEPERPPRLALVSLHLFRQNRSAVLQVKRSLELLDLLPVRERGRDNGDALGQRANRRRLSLGLVDGEQGRLVARLAEARVLLGSPIHPLVGVGGARTPGSCRWWPEAEGSRALLPPLELVESQGRRSWSFVALVLVCEDLCDAVLARNAIHPDLQGRELSLDDRDLELIGHENPGSLPRGFRQLLG